MSGCQFLCFVNPRRRLPSARQRQIDAANVSEWHRPRSRLPNASSLQPSEDLVQKRLKVAKCQDNDIITPTDEDLIQKLAPSISFIKYADGKIEDLLRHLITT